MTKAQDIGRYGEQIVHDILETANWKNPFTESNLDYDMTWEGIKIEVKASFQHSPTSRIAYQFSNVNKGDDVVLVAIGFDEKDGEPIFWVRKCSELKYSMYAKVSDAIKKENLKNAIKSIA